MISSLSTARPSQGMGMAGAIGSIYSEVRWPWRIVVSDGWVKLPMNLPAFSGNEEIHPTSYKIECRLGAKVFHENGQTIHNSYEIATGV